MNRSMTRMKSGSSKGKMKIKSKVNSNKRKVSNTPGTTGKSRRIAGGGHRRMKAY